MDKSSKRQLDCREELFMELRKSRPPIYFGDEWERWREAIGQVISAYPTLERRWACVTLVADDLAKAMPGLPISQASRDIAEAVFEAQCREGRPV